MDVLREFKEVREEQRCGSDTDIREAFHGHNEGAWTPAGSVGKECDRSTGKR